MASLASRLARIKQQMDPPCWCITNYTQFDDGVILPDKREPVCPHGRPWRPGKVYVMGGPPREIV